MISTLSKAGSGYTYSTVRTFDAWGNIRLGAQTGDPKGRYCASIGHKQDDESGLVYMRARYYEPGSGRFVSEDSKRDGQDWFVYCHNNPDNEFDPTGTETFTQMFLITAFAAMMTGIAGWESALWVNPQSADSAQKALIATGAAMLFGGMIAGLVFADGKALTALQFWGKFIQNGLVGAATGGAIAAVAAGFAGEEAGKLLSELVYIDYGT